jgi:hypothetical protein
MIKINGTSGITNVDGTAASPALTGADTDTGVFTGTDIVGISTGGTEKVRVDASGNVGVGTSSPTDNLQVSGSGNRIIGVSCTGTGGAGLELISSGSNGFIGYNADLRFATITGLGAAGFTERARIDSSGNLLVGKTSSSGATEGVELRSSPAAGSAVATFTRDGDVAVGFRRNTNDGNVILFLSRTGTTIGSISVTATATAYNTSSDYRLKEDVQPMENSVDRLMTLKPVNFAWKADGSRVDGFLAHEAQEVVPESVTGEKDAVDADGNPEYQGIDQSKIVPLLTAALQEAIAEIGSLKARIEQLEQA